jgi:hypothetical protein
LTHKTTDTDSADMLTGTGTVPNERGKDGETCTEHAGDGLGLEPIRNGEDELLMGHDAGGVAALGTDSIGLLAHLRMRDICQDESLKE